jgi:predicted amidophosphoribosyltransferase
MGRIRAEPVRVCRGWRPSFAALRRDCARFARQRCGLRVAVPVATCGACLNEPPPFDACIVVCDYAFPWDRLIADFKFNARVELAAPLALRLVHAIRQRGGEMPALVLPVPLAPGRLAERGYNQAWELARLAPRCRADAAARAARRGRHQARRRWARRQSARAFHQPAATRAAAAAPCRW